MQSSLIFIRDIPKILPTSLLFATVVWRFVLSPYNGPQSARLPILKNHALLCRCSLISRNGSMLSECPMSTLYLMSRNIPFGLLAAFPTENPHAALAEDGRATHGLHADGFNVICKYNGVVLGYPSVDPAWEDFHRRHDVVFVPDAYAPAPISRPSPLVKVPFENVRTVLAMLYSGTFGDLAGITCTLAHSGGALPMLFSRLKLLGTQPWVPNANNITQEEAHVQLAKYIVLRLRQLLRLLMMPPDLPVYGMGCGVQCSTEPSLEANKEAVLEYETLLRSQRDAIGQSVLSLLPVVVATLGKCCLAEGSCFVTDA